MRARAATHAFARNAVDPTAWSKLGASGRYFAPSSKSRHMTVKALLDVKRKLLRSFRGGGRIDL